MKAKKKAKEAVLERIKAFEEAIIRGREYLESGKHANWQGFRPLFYGKVQSGKEMPPHRDWVEKVFLPIRERALRHAEKVLLRLEREGMERAKDE
jgi:hypothetical protein